MNDLKINEECMKTDWTSWKNCGRKLGYRRRPASNKSSGDIISRSSHAPFNLET